MAKIFRISIIYFAVIIIGLIATQLLYLGNRNNFADPKKALVAITGLPDLSLSTSAHFVRHRSLSDLFSIFSNAPTLSEFFPATFVYHYSLIQKKNPSRIELEK